MTGAKELVDEEGKIREDLGMGPEDACVILKRDGGVHVMIHEVDGVTHENGALALGIARRLMKDGDWVDDLHEWIRRDIEQMAQLERANPEGNA